MEVYITITGLRYYIDELELKIGQELILKKEPDNKFDSEAIMVLKSDFTKIGYVAKSYKTQAKGTYSAGRIYDRIGDNVKAEIMFIIHETVIARVSISQ